MNKISLRLKLTLIFAALLAFTLWLIVFLNNQFLDDFYYEEKTQKMIDSYERVKGMLESGTYSDDEIGLEMDKIRDKYNISMLYMDSQRKIIGNYASRIEETTMQQKLVQYMLGSLSGRVTIYSDEFAVVKIVYSDENMQIWETAAPNTQMSYLESWGFFNSHVVFVMSTPLESIRESVEVANRLLVYVGVAVMLFTAIVLMLVTRQFTKPILELAEISEKMSQLDFKKRYMGKEQDEIGILGNSINTMADRLQLTIEELQGANEQLKRDIQEKVQIDEVRKEFLSNVSHELKTPIALIQGYAEGLQEAVNDNPESRDFYCEVIIDEAGKMNKMVRKLLTLNHLEFGQDVLDITEFDMVSLVQSVVDANAITMKQKDAKLILNLPELAVVTGDEFKTEEVITNFLSNALNHLAYDKKIEIAVIELNGKIRVSVYNTGDPIPEEDLDKIWEKFYKVDKARTRAYGGSGIGLSIVKAIMESMGEKYGVWNRPGGVEFWFELSKAVIEMQEAAESS